MQVVYASCMNATSATADPPSVVVGQCIGSRYRAPMATVRKTPQHTVAIENELWAALKDAAESAGYDRPGVLRQFVRWYLRAPGARLPQRPTLAEELSLAPQRTEQED